MAEIITGTNIAKLAELAHKDTVNECICWLIDHYHMVGEEVVRLQEFVKDLAEKNGALMNTNGRLWTANVGLQNENKKLDGKLSMAAAALDGAIAGNGGLENKNSNLRESNKAYSAEIDELKNEIAERDEANMDLREENQKYKKVFETGGCSALLSNVELYRSRNNVLAEENKELKARIVDLEESEKQSIETMKIMGINCIGDLVKQNEELKESLRSIQQMDKEEPCERIESLMEDVQRLTTENGKLEDLNRELSQNLEERNLKSKMLEKDYTELRLNMAGIRGELIAYKYVISQMFAKK